MKYCGLVSALTICLSLVHLVNCLAVMSVDLGTEWMKVGVVSPGVPMEIALNKESKRKSPAILSFKDNERLFGEDAQSMGIRFPKFAYIYLLDLLGKDFNHPMVKLYQKRFPYYEIIEDVERKTILFRHDKDTLYSVEELLAQFFAKAKEFAESAAHQPIKECVVTVPGYFNQIERRALAQAVKLANLKLLQLINDYTAVALNYGIFRSKDFNESSQYVMFYDMGASSTTATIVSFQTSKTKEKGYLETHPELTVLGVGYDRTLGGLEMQLRLRDYLGTKFNEVKKTDKDVFGNPRSMAKLFKEAGRLKNVLSANSQHYAQIEGLLDEEDFKLLVTRQEFEDLIPDLLERVKKPVEQALKTAQLSKDVLNQVVLFGAGTRVPKVQEILEKIVGQQLAKNLNTDEAAALGAVYKAADLSSGFQVKKFITKDAVMFPIQVVFERETENNVKKQVKRTLFGLMNPYPQKKIITFNKHTYDFVFNVNYADLGHIPPQEVKNVGTLNLTEISLSGVKEVLLRYANNENIDSKGIKAHFQMDESGLLHLVNIEYVAEKPVVENDEEGTLSKLGNTISKLFGGEETPPQQQQQDEEEKPREESNHTAQATEETTIPKANQTANETKSNNSTTKSKPPSKPKIVTLKEPIKSTEKQMGIPALTNEQIASSQEKLRKLDELERQITRRATALNELETFVLDVQTKLSEDEYSESATEEEKEKIIAICLKISDWLYEEGSDADAETYVKKLESLKTETNPLFARVWEHNERPEALSALNAMLNHSVHFLASAKNLTLAVNPDKDVFTDKEVESLEKAIRETEEWTDKNVDAQKQLKKNEPVVLTVKSITDKMALLDREVKYLVNKLRLWRPKKEDSSTTNSSSADEKEVKAEKKSKSKRNYTEKNEEHPEDSEDDVKDARTESESEMNEEIEKGNPPHHEL